MIFILLVILYVVTKVIVIMIEELNIKRLKKMVNKMKIGHCDE